MNNQNWMNVFSQPFAQAARKIIFQLVGEEWTKHDRIMDVMFRSIISERDYEEFGKLITEVYEAGYMRAISEHEKELKKLGLQVNLKKVESKQESERHPLF